MTHAQWAERRQAELIAEELHRLTCPQPANHPMYAVIEPEPEPEPFGVVLTYAHLEAKYGHRWQRTWHRDDAEVVERPRLVQALASAGTLDGAARQLGWSRAGIRKRARRWHVAVSSRPGRPRAVA